MLILMSVPLWTPAFSADLSPDALLVNLDGRCVYANPTAAYLFGADDAQKIVGLSPFDLLEADYHPMLHAQMQSVLQDGKASARLEYRWKKLDQTTVEVSAGPVKWNGKPAVQFIARDIS